MTELIWQVADDILRVSLPFQTVETVNESTMERQRVGFGEMGRSGSDWMIVK